MCHQLINTFISLILCVWDLSILLYGILFIHLSFYVAWIYLNLFILLSWILNFFLFSLTNSAIINILIYVKKKKEWEGKVPFFFFFIFPLCMLPPPSLSLKNFYKIVSTFPYMFCRFHSLNNLDIELCLWKHFNLRILLFYKIQARYFAKIFM